MQPGGGVPDGTTKLDHPPATGGRHDHDAPPPPPPPPLKVYQRNKRRQKNKLEEPMFGNPEGPLVIETIVNPPTQPSAAVPKSSSSSSSCSGERAEEQAMQPGPHGTTNLDHPPATGRRHNDAALVHQRKKKPRQKNKLEENKLEERHGAMFSSRDGPLFNVLSRLPYPALCRFKCVSTDWLAVCSSPDVRKSSTQTLSGFFHNRRSSSKGSLRFRNLNGRGPPMVDPALPFLMRRGYTRFKLKQCSTSLLLCKCWKPCPDEDAEKMDLVVCNPATEELYVLPPTEEEEEDDHACFKTMDAFLGFDAAFPSCFLVFVLPKGRTDDVIIYSSKTGQWKRTRRGDGDVLATDECVYLNGVMHMVIEDDCIFAVDAKGDSNIIRLPLPVDIEDTEGIRANTSIGQSQGLLHAWYIDTEEGQLFLWVMKNYESENWTLKHTVDITKIFNIIPDEVVAIHPERNIIFITDSRKTTISYNMDNKDVHAMCNSGEFLEGLPYIPFFGDWLPHAR